MSVSLATVRKLIETAESFRAQGNKEAADTYQAKAEALMGDARKDEEELLAQDPTSLTPVMAKIVVCGPSNPWQSTYSSLFWTICRHAETMVTFVWERPAEGGLHEVVGCVVGYESDVRYAEMLYTAARLVFGEKMEPQVDRSLSDQVNAYRLRGSGMERVRVAELIWGNRDKANLSRVGRYYKAECAARGEAAALDGRGVTGRVYREQYAQEFVWALSSRMRRASDAAGKMGGGVVLHGRKERIEEAFYTYFPHLRPAPANAVDMVEQECEACKRTKSETGLCRDHRPRNTTREDEARWRRYNSPAARRGREAGTAAARHVNLGGTQATNLPGAEQKGLGA
jgi:hypothetical protein